MRIQSRGEREFDSEATAATDRALGLYFGPVGGADRLDYREAEARALGLAIVKSICTAHGAEIETESTIGRGSCFRIKFPLAAAVDSH